MEYGIIGMPLGHSFSKPIHESISPITYHINALTEKEVVSLLQKKEFIGLNVTIPYKQFVMNFLDEIDPKAKKIHAVNTIINKNGKLYGYNTDYGGLKKMILDHKINVSNKHCAILGNGGTHNTTYALLSDLGAKSVLTVTRKKEQNTITFDEFKTHKEIEIIINTTPVGMYPNNYCKPISLEYFPSLEGLVDVVYNPLRTPLVLEAKEKNINSTGGLEMLVNQAIIANEYFFSRPNDESLYKSIYKQLFLNKANIVLIGMPMSGKTTIGYALAKKLGKEYIDIDEEITKEIKMPIKEYFSKYGEEAFRKIEAELTLKIAKETNYVISPGGGIVKNIDNIRALKQNGFIIFLDRDENLLVYDRNRPLTKNKDEYKKLLQERLHLYKTYSDVRIENNGTIEEAVLKIVEVFNESINY